MSQNYVSKNPNLLNPNTYTSLQAGYSTPKKAYYNIKSLISFLSLFVLLLFGSNVHGQGTTTVYITTTGSGTWTVPAGVTGSIIVEAWGAGGSGGGASGKNVTGSGGSGGTYVKSTFTSIVAGTTYNLYVAPQTSVGATGNNGNNGSDSWFISNTTLNANGGLGGKSANGTAVMAITTGSVGATIIAGGSSASAASVYYGTAGGNGGNSGGTGGANSATPSNNFPATGNPGAAPGGAGGGAATGGGSCGCSTTGGTGARGEIRITYTNPTCAIPTNQPTTLSLTPASTAITGSFTLPSPIADNYLVVASTSSTAPTPVNGTTYSIGSNALGSSTIVVDTDGNNTFTANGLAGNTLYYIYVFSYNSACTGGPKYNTTSPLNGSTTTLTPSYCASTYVTGTTYFIGNVNVAGINNTTTNTQGLPMYANHTSIVGNVIAGNSYVFSGNISTGSNTATVYTWIDWNRDGFFNNAEYPAGERYTMSSCNSGSSNCPVNGTITVPAGALIGSARMRVSVHRSIDGLAGTACQTTLGYGETEDYTISVSSTVACLTPTAQPTVMNLTPTGNTITGTFTYASPTANNYLVVINTTGTTPSPANGTTYAVGDLIGSGNTVIDIDSNNSFSVSGLSQLTTYSVYIFAYNSLCTGGPLYNTTNPLIKNTTTLGATYCTPTGNLNCASNDFISNVTLNTLNNTSTCGAGGYTNYAATGTQTTTLTKGTSYTFSLKVGAGSGTHGAGVWIDFNQNGVFSDAGEFFLVSNSIAANSTTTITIPIPVGALSGATRMRVRYAYTLTASASQSCAMSGTYGETEDYTITLANAAVCATPTAQPTALLLTANNTSISGTFTYASPAANNYLVTISTSNTAPSPVNGTTYAVGAVIGSSTVVDIDNNNTFLVTGLNSSTQYYIHIFSYNSLCTGGPLYLVTTPLTANTTTLTASPYCIPTVSSSTWAAWDYMSTVSFVGTLNDTSNNSTYSTTPLGYQDFTGIVNKPKQAQGEGVNVFVQAKNTSFMKAWVDWNKDGIFSDPSERVYDTGNIATYSTTFGFIIPAATALGDYRVRIRINSKDTKSPYDSNSTSTFGPCGNINYGGETEDYLFTVVASCASLITAVTDGISCGPGVVTLNAAGSAGTTGFNWYAAATGGSPLNASPTPTGTWNTPSLTTTTTYYVTAINGCESLVRTAIVANINPVPTLTFTPSNPVVCGENTVITLNASGDKQQTYLINENFEAGTLGVFTNSNILSTTENSKTAWQNRTSTFVPKKQVWFPAISSGFGPNKFAMATSDVGDFIIHNALISPKVNSTNYLDLTLTLKVFYSRYYIDDTAPTLDYVTLDVSQDDGVTWTEITRYISDIGIGTRFENLSFNLNAYINKPNLRIRIRYYGEWVDGIAVDDIKLFGFTPLSTAFTWSSTSSPVNAFSDAACTVAYSTPVPTVYIKPTLAQLESGSYSFTANATLSNGCTASQPITITNTSKVWKGLSTNWDDPANWKPAGLPTIDNCVIIPNNSIISGSNYNAYAKNLTVKSTGNLELQSTNNITVADWVNVNTSGIFNIRNNASLVQINNVSNTGIVNVERTTPGIRQLDYTYWSSPVSGFSLGSYSTSNSYMYSWIPTISNGGGNWKPESDASIMGVGKGYIIRTPWGHTDGATYTAKFTGPPNNGDVLTPISKGTNANMVPGTVDDEDDEWNLIGNPYPSGLNIAKLIDLPANLNVIDGTVYIWTHNTLPSTAAPDPFYGDYVRNYTAEDYATVNKTGTTVTAGAASTGTRVPTAYIAAGQSFFIKSANTMPNGTTANVTFNNAMRETGQNNNFFKQVSTTKNESIPRSIPDLEKHRIWLNLTNNADAFSQILIGYIEGATKGLDRGFDGESLGGNDVTFYSVIPEAKLTIQGRNLPFDENDQIALGYNAAVEGTYSIRIDHTDGLLDNQKIYLIDQLTQKTHDLRAKPYEFDSEEGDFNDRFILRFNSTAKTLGTETFELSNTVTVIVKENVTVKSTSETIKTIEVFDLLGKKIDSYKKVNASQYTLSHLNKTTAGLIVKITLENDTVISKKIIY